MVTVSPASIEVEAIEPGWSKDIAETNLSSDMAPVSPYIERSVQSNRSIQGGGASFFGRGLKGGAPLCISLNLQVCLANRMNPVCIREHFLSVSVFAIAVCETD